MKIEKIGIIGGSGLEKSDVAEKCENLEILTKYGNAKLKKFLLKGAEIFFISRHGENHEITPSKVNNRANISALFQLGCRHIIATTAVGSLKDSISPGDFVIANQFIDFTKKRDTTFFNDFSQGIKHTGMAEPFSKFLRDILIDSCVELGLKHHKIGTIVTIEGPRFSTRAESFMFKKFAHVINMSTAPEAILANELGIDYSAVAMTTDYDCWKKNENPVTWEEIERIMKQNSDNVKKLLIRAIENILKYDESEKEIEFIRGKIRTIPNFPKQGIMFRDITTLLKDNQAMEKVIKIFVDRYKDKKIDIIAGIESRGFIFGAALADKINVGFIPIRKPGKLPYEKIREEYALEYGKDAVEVHKDAVKPGDNILLVDDLLATGGTMQAAGKLIEKLGGKIEECCFLIELPDLKGREKLRKWNVFSIVKFEGK